MYSLMSMRTMAFSSSNRNSASALASSVLPTPVGPRKRNEPIGRFGSDRPARRGAPRWTRHDGLVLADDALWQASSMLDELSPSRPPSMRLTGMPVHLETTSATSSSSTSSLSSMLGCPELAARARWLRSSCSFELGDLP
jgi:hypothetical protein